MKEFVITRDFVGHYSKITGRPVKAQEGEQMDTTLTVKFHAGQSVKGFQDPKGFVIVPVNPKINVVLMPDQAILPLEDNSNPVNNWFLK